MIASVPLSLPVDGRGSHPEAHLLLALCLAWLEMPAEAALSCSHAIALQPHSRATLLLQTCLASRLGDRAAASRSLQALKRLDRPAQQASSAKERLLPEVIHWVRRQPGPPPLDLDQL